MKSFINSRLWYLRQKLLACGVDRRASVAVEFTFIAPLMFIMWLGSVAICEVYHADTQVFNAAQSAANVAADELGTVSGDIANICNAAKLSMYPFPTNGKLWVAVASVSNTSTFGQATPYKAINLADNSTFSNFTTNYNVDLLAAGNASGGTCASDTGAYNATTNPNQIKVPAAMPTSTGTVSGASTDFKNDYEALVPEPRDSVIIVQVTYEYSLLPTGLVGFAGVPGSFTLSHTAFSRPRNGSSPTP